MAAWALDVFPAYAGMSPGTAPSRTDTSRFPRLRGDEPVLAGAVSAVALFSPPTRG